MEPRTLVPRTVLAVLLACGLALTGCKSNESKPDNSSQPASQPAEAPVAEAAPAPAPAATQKPICQDEPAQPTSRKKKSKKKSKKAAKAAPPVDCIPASEAAAASAEPAPEPVAASPRANGSYDLSKNKPITDSSKAETGQGTKVKGINDWEGEISGIPAANSQFTRLKIGMSEEEVFDLIGPPTDHGAYVTGKAWIPFYHGSDRVRSEAVYKGQGRLIFSSQAGWGSSGQYLTWIIHNSHEPGYR